MVSKVAEDGLRVTVSPSVFGRLSLLGMGEMATRSTKALSKKFSPGELVECEVVLVRDGVVWGCGADREE